MLNAANLAFVGFSRLFGELDGQIFALAVMAVAAVRGVRRARADRRDGAAEPRARRRPVHGAAGLVRLMAVGGWICLLAPLAGFLAILLAGTRITRRQAGLISTGSVFVGFAGAVVAFVDALGRDPDDRVELTTAWTWLEAGDFEVGLELLVDPLSLVMMLDRHRRRRADRRLLERLHGRRRRGAALLRVHGVLRLLDAAARRGRQPAHAARRLGPRRARVVPPDRLPPRPPLGGRGGEEGVRHQRARRRDHGARLLPPHLPRRHASTSAPCSTPPSPASSPTPS